MHNDFIQERKDFIIITIHTITPVGKQDKDSAYVHVSDISLTVIKLSYLHKKCFTLSMKFRILYIFNKL